MEKNRFIQVMGVDLYNDIIIMEEKLEVAMNSDVDIELKIKTVKKLLNKITVAEKMYIKFTSLVSDSFESPTINNEK